MVSVASRRGRIAGQIRDGLERGRAIRAQPPAAAVLLQAQDRFTPVVVLPPGDRPPAPPAFVAYRWVASSGAFVSAIWLFSIGLTAIGVVAGVLALLLLLSMVRAVGRSVRRLVYGGPAS
jgi:hypothetical protein